MRGGRGETCARDEAATAMLSNAGVIRQQRRARLRRCQFSRLAPLTDMTNKLVCLSLSLSAAAPFPSIVRVCPPSPHHTTYYSTTPPFKCRPAKTSNVLPTSSQGSVLLERQTIQGDKEYVDGKSFKWWRLKSCMHYFNEFCNVLATCSDSVWSWQLSSQSFPVLYETLSDKTQLRSA